MSRWEIKVYGFGVGHMYTMYSNAQLENVKRNMMRRFAIHSSNSSKVAIMAIRDLEEDNIVHVREIMKSGLPQYRIWRKIKYSIDLYPDKESWDKAVSSKLIGVM